MQHSLPYSRQPNHAVSIAIMRLMKCLPCVVGLLLLSVSAAALAKPSAAEGKAISGQCASCHGARGVAVNTKYPDLAGQNYQYLVYSLKRFKTGKRDNAIMNGIAKGLSSKQIDDLAAYYASLTKINCRSNNAKSSQSSKSS